MTAITCSNLILYIPSEALGHMKSDDNPNAMVEMRNTQVSDGRFKGWMTHFQVKRDGISKALSTGVNRKFPEQGSFTETVRKVTLDTTHRLQAPSSGSWPTSSNTYH